PASIWAAIDGLVRHVKHKPEFRVRFTKDADYSLAAVALWRRALTDHSVMVSTDVSGMKMYVFDPKTMDFGIYSPDGVVSYYPYTLRQSEDCLAPEPLRFWLPTAWRL